MASLNGYDATQYDPRGTFDLIPNGEYLAEICESESKATKANDGSSYLNIKFQVLQDGPAKGRFLWARLNNVNRNAQTVAIAMAELSAICHAVGVLRPNDTIELHRLPLIIVVKQRKNKQSDELENYIAGYKTKDGKTPGKPAGTNQPSSPNTSPASGPGAAPWKK